MVRAEGGMVHPTSLHWARGKKGLTGTGPREADGGWKLSHRCSWLHVSLPESTKRDGIGRHQSSQGRSTVWHASVCGRFSLWQWTCIVVDKASGTPADRELSFPEQHGTRKSKCHSAYVTYICTYSTPKQRYAVGPLEQGDHLEILSASVLAELSRGPRVVIAPLLA
jgi:hypothetical protein